MLQNQLKDIQAQKRKLAAEQKQIKEQLAATKSQREEARKLKSESRKNAKLAKSDIRTLSAKVVPVMKEGDPEAIAKLADAITEAATLLAQSVRNFGEASVEPEVEELETDGDDD